MLASISLSSGVLTMQSDSLTTKMIVDYSSSTKLITASINYLVQTFPVASVTAIHINGSPNPDDIEVTNTLSIPASIHGGAGNDTIYGGAGNDHIWGEAGNNYISGRNGSDFLYGGTGNDTLDGGNGTDTGDAGTGTNVFISVEDITGGLPVNPPPVVGKPPVKTPPVTKPPTTGGTSTGGTSTGGTKTGGTTTSGTGTSSSGSSTSTSATSGTISLANGVLTILGSAKSTKITVGYNSSTKSVTAQIDAGTVKSFIKTSVASITIIGGANGEYISVTNTLTIPALIRGMGGNDTIFGGGGNDSITGDAGNDALAGRDGNDGFLGGAGNDTIDGGPGKDLADGGAGTNKLINIETTGTYSGAIPPSSGSSGSTTSSTGSTGSTTGSTGARPDRPEVRLAQPDDHWLDGFNGFDRLNRIHRGIDNSHAAVQPHPASVQWRVFSRCRHHRTGKDHQLRRRNSRSRVKLHPQRRHGPHRALCLELR